MTFTKILTLCEKHGFLNKSKIAPTGMLLQQNLKNEWLNSTVNNKDTPVFLSNDNFAESVNFAKEICTQSVPFGIAEMIQTKNVAKAVEENKHEFVNFFENESSLLLKCTVFVSPKVSVQFFHQWQKQRRMWWRKFSANPGIYSFSDIRINGTFQTVDILANYAWGTQLLETISLLTDSEANFEIKEGRTVFQPHVVVNETNLSTMLLNAVCDAYDEPKFQGNPRPLFQFHRKLAPYKMSFVLTSAGSLSELKDLALYLCKQLRENHVSTLFVPSCSKLTQDAQFKQYDQMGIPYNICLNENTLKNGVILLRSRDTTLKEQVHVSTLVKYVEKLLKNY